MPLKRRIIKVGNSRAVIIPASWLKFHEDKHGEVTEILMELNNAITLTVQDDSKEPSRVARV